MLAPGKRAGSLLVGSSIGDSIGKGSDEGGHDGRRIAFSLDSAEPSEIREGSSRIHEGRRVDAPRTTPRRHHQSRPPREIAFRIAGKLESLPISPAHPARDLPFGQYRGDRDRETASPGIDRVQKETTDPRWKG